MPTRPQEYPNLRSIFLSSCIKTPKTTFMSWFVFRTAYSMKKGLKQLWFCRSIPNVFALSKWRAAFMSRANLSQLILEWACTKCVCPLEGHSHCVPSKRGLYEEWCSITKWAKLKHATCDDRSKTGSNTSLFRDWLHCCKAHLCELRFDCLHRHDRRFRKAHAYARDLASQQYHIMDCDWKQLR